MSHTPDEQLLNDPIDKILDGIEDFNAAANARIKNAGEWDESHIEELNGYRKRLMDLEVSLRQLKRELDN